MDLKKQQATRQYFRYSLSEFTHSFSFTPLSELYEWTNVGNSEWGYRGDFRYSPELGVSDKGDVCL